jgi:biotin carboxyl carrier protein
LRSEHTASAHGASSDLPTTQAAQPRTQQQVWVDLEAYTRQVHGSLDLCEVAHLAANQGRLLLGCDQVSLAVRRGRRVAVEAVSGAPAVERRGRLVECMRALFDSVLAWGEKLVYTGARDESLPPAVFKALDAYLVESNSKLLVLLPLRDPRRQGQGRRGQAAVLAESFDPALTLPQLESRLEVAVPHVASALHNALDYQRASRGWFARCRDRFEEWADGKRSRRAAAVAAGALLVVGALAVFPAPLRVDAHGHLLPEERQIVYAPLHGRVVEMKTQHGDRVAKDQELLLLEDLGTQLKVEELGMKVTFAEQRLALLGEQLRRAAGDEDRSALVKERIQQEYELRRAAAERDILLQGSVSPRKAPVTAPLAGKVVTFDAREQLVGKTVKPSDPLLRVARVDGPWEIQLDIPGRHIAPVREALRRSGAAGLEVQLLLASQPLRTYHGRLRWEGLGGETAVKDNVVVLPARVEIVDGDLLGELGRTPVNLEVRARIDCGLRPVGRVWFGDLLEFLYEHLWF